MCQSIIKKVRCVFMPIDPSQITLCITNQALNSLLIPYGLNTCLACGANSICKAPSHKLGLYYCFGGRLSILQIES